MQPHPIVSTLLPITALSTIVNPPTKFCKSLTFWVYEFRTVLTM